MRIGSVVNRIAFGGWSQASRGGLNWFGEALQERLTAATTRPSAVVALAGASPATPLNLGLLFDPNSEMVAMAEEVTIGQMRQFVEETGYVSEGHNVTEFNRLIHENEATAPMVFTNETDCIKFAEWALSKAKEQDPRIKTLGLPSDNQWLKMRATFRSQQKGSFWERLSDGLFRSFQYGSRGYSCSRESRSGGNAFRLVGTYKS